MNHPPLQPYRQTPTPPKVNADQVYVLQAGFIGSWGEWHNSMHNLKSNATGVSDMIKRELFTLLPPDRKLQVRVPEYKSQLILRSV